MTPGGGWWSRLGCVVEGEGASDPTQKKFMFISGRRAACYPAKAGRFRKSTTKRALFFTKIMGACQRAFGSLIHTFSACSWALLTLLFGCTLASFSHRRVIRIKEIWNFSRKSTRSHEIYRKYLGVYGRGKGLFSHTYPPHVRMSMERHSRIRMSVILMGWGWSQAIQGVLYAEGDDECAYFRKGSPRRLFWKKSCCFKCRPNLERSQRFEFWTYVPNLSIIFKRCSTIQN